MELERAGHLHKKNRGKSAISEVAQIIDHLTGSGPFLVILVSCTRCKK